MCVGVFHTWKCYLFSNKANRKKKSLKSFLHLNSMEILCSHKTALSKTSDVLFFFVFHQIITIIPYLSSNFSSSSFALDATVFTADDTLVSTALLLFSILTVSFSDDADDDGFVVIAAVV